MDKDSDAAAAKVYRLAQATALLRLYREREGHEAESTEALSEWAHHQRLPRPITPTDADYRAVERDHPELAALARRSNPYLSGDN